MINEAIKVFRENQGLFAFCATVSGIIFSFIGGLIGHRLSVGRDRRLARIAVKQRIRARLLKARGDLGSAIEDDMLIGMLSKKDGRGFKAAMAEYNDHYRNLEKDSYGSHHPPDPAAIAAAIDKLLPYTAER